MKVTSVLAFLLIFHTLSAQSWTALDEALEAKKKLLGNHFVALVWKGDSLVYKKEVGEFNMKTQVPIASASKWLTAALVMQQVDEGKISLDDKVVKYVPEFEKYFKSYITIRQCLSHMTGIDDDGGIVKKILQRRKYNSLEEEVNAFAARNIRANAGTDFWYGNIGLNIAGRVLEVATKKKFEILIKTKLFNPLGMRRTTFTDLNGNPVNPSGGAQSTAEDYLKFLVMLLNKGKHNGVQVLSEASVNEMMKLQTRPELMKYAPKSAQGYGYALGAWVAESDASGNGISVASPGMFGTWPLVDYCRGYVYLVFVKNLLGDERAEVHKELKQLIDTELEKECPSK